MNKLHNIELYTDSFFVGALFPFVEEGTMYVMTVQHLDKYKRGEIRTKLPGGSGDSSLASESKYFARLEEIMKAMSFERRAELLIMNQEYSRREKFNEHPDKKGIYWLLQTLVLRCLEATGYYPADLEPWVVDVVERSEDHYQYFLEIKEWWDHTGEKITAPVPDPEFIPLDKDIVLTRERIPMLDFEEELIDSHCRPVEFYLEHLRNMAMQARQKPDEE